MNYKNAERWGTIISGREPSYINFENNYICDECDGDILYECCIDGYPDPVISDQGSVICTVFITRRGDTGTVWHHNGYQGHEKVLDLVRDAKTKLSEMYHKSGCADNERQKIFRDVLREYDKEGANRQLHILIGFDSDISVFGTEPLKLEELSSEDLESIKRFEDEYRVSYETACGMLDHFASRFEEEQDCNVPENDTWQYVITEELRKEASAVKI